MRRQDAKSISAKNEHWQDSFCIFTSFELNIEITYQTGSQKGNKVVELQLHIKQWKITIFLACPLKSCEFCFKGRLSLHTQGWYDSKNSRHFCSNAQLLKALGDTESPDSLDTGRH